MEAPGDGLLVLVRRGSRGGEMGGFSLPPFSEPPSFFFFSYPSNTEMMFDFSDIITKILSHFKILDPPLLVIAKEIRYYS